MEEREEGEDRKREIPPDNPLDLDLVLLRVKKGNALASTRLSGPHSASQLDTHRSDFESELSFLLSPSLQSAVP